MRTSIATVCLSGTLAQKLDASARAGFDGVEIFEPDFMASSSGPERVRQIAEDLGLSLDLYQPFRDFEGVSQEKLRQNLRRARAKFDLMNRLGIDTILLCSNVGTAISGDDALAVEQLRQLGDLAAEKIFFVQMADAPRLTMDVLSWSRHHRVFPGEGGFNLANFMGHLLRSGY